ncbi:MAG: polynucleotide adenylyltransferase, partial [Clostridia bacterium]|nr:polynucleotide adenylyltransferase [Clostridia bacterium]
MKETALSIVKKLEENGYSAYLVGGSVRDELLSRAVNDFDIATNASPQAVMQVFAHERVVETGIKHGTVTIVIDHHPYEVTTFRTEGDYKDCRHPETVSFVTSLKEDLERRDFTINALAYNPETGIVDYFGGVDDLNNKIIRAVGEPQKRFQEDALRILRAVRFSAQLGFEIEKNTLSA